MADGFDFNRMQSMGALGSNGAGGGGGHLFGRGGNTEGLLRDVQGLFTKEVNMWRSGQPKKIVEGWKKVGQELSEISNAEWEKFRQASQNLIGSATDITSAPTSSNLGAPSSGHLEVGE